MNIENHKRLNPKINSFCWEWRVVSVKVLNKIYRTERYSMKQECVVRSKREKWTHVTLGCLWRSAQGWYKVVTSRVCEKTVIDKEGSVLYKELYWNITSNKEDCTDELGLRRARIWWNGLKIADSESAEGPMGAYRDVDRGVTVVLRDNDEIGDKHPLRIGMTESGRIRTKRCTNEDYE